VRRVGIIGAGVISAVHAEALKQRGHIRLTAVVDPNEAAARAFARRWDIEQVFGSVAAAIESRSMDAAHVLVPPPLHSAVALPLLEAGIAVLVEKPMATSACECALLQHASRSTGTPLAVNQNFLFHPAFLRLRQLLDAGRYGPPRSVTCTYSVPLRQLAARQFGHWMFRAPGNILLEQAVHPLSQVMALAGAIRGVRAVAGPGKEISPGVDFHASVDVTLDCEELPAQLSFAVGRSFPVWQICVLCDDGMIVADVLLNRVYGHGRTRWIEPIDNLLSGARTATMMMGAGISGLAWFGLSTLRLAGRRDPFFLSMRNSIGAFHESLSGGTTFPSGACFGAALVEACESIRDSAFHATSAKPATPALQSDQSCDVTILGGTGFIGAEVVRQVLRSGMRVSVMARTTSGLPGLFSEREVQLTRGDIRDPEAVQRAIGKAPVVVNLAHGGGGADFAAIRDAMLGGAETVARACMAASSRLIHVGSIASLYCGSDAGVISGATPPDPEDERRGDYARAKILCDRLLLDLHERASLNVVILRPGLVVGEGTSPFHSGLGFYNNEQHCIGWNAGRNPLPFVLVQDVAAALVLAMKAETIDGRCFNLVGDVRPSARDFLHDLGQATGRPLRFHPKSPTVLWLEEGAKWIVKRFAGRSSPLPSRRDLMSRGLGAQFDCGDAKRELGWAPIADPVEFMRLVVGGTARD
jgi:predicted dehydrogenase/nucleoside-diphosphate-sugar epimerase